MVEAINRKSNVFEVMNQVMVYFGYIEPFLESNPELSPATRRKIT